MMSGSQTRILLNQSKSLQEFDVSIRNMQVLYSSYVLISDVLNYMIFNCITAS
jgi:hypothetical protein